MSSSLLGLVVELCLPSSVLLLPNRRSYQAQHKSRWLMRRFRRYPNLRVWSELATLLERRAPNSLDADSSMDNQALMRNQVARYGDTQQTSAPTCR